VHRTDEGDLVLPLVEHGTTLERATWSVKRFAYAVSVVPSAFSLSQNGSPSDADYD
jgi:hypothetical protein